MRSPLAETRRMLTSIAGAGLTFRMERIAVREAIKEEITLVHSPAHWDRVRGTGCAFLSSPDSALAHSQTRSPNHRLPRSLLRVL